MESSNGVVEQSAGAVDGQVGVADGSAEQPGHPAAGEGPSVAAEITCKECLRCGKGSRKGSGKGDGKGERTG